MFICQFWLNWDYWLSVIYEGGQICTHMESLKFPTTPGDSPGVGLRKHGLLALQRIPCSHGSVPADGIALLGKWPADRKVATTHAIVSTNRERRIILFSYFSSHQALAAPLQLSLMGDVVVECSLQQKTLVYDSCGSVTLSTLNIQQTLSCS